jgi:hypothetical protein
LYWRSVLSVDGSNRLKMPSVRFAMENSRLGLPDDLAHARDHGLKLTAQAFHCGRLGGSCAALGAIGDFLRETQRLSDHTAR